MIRSFEDKLTADLFDQADSKRINRIPIELRETAIRRLDQIHAAINLTDLRVPPGNRLEKLKGDLKQFHSIRVNNQFRIIFEWKSDGAHSVSFIDYHRG